MSKDSVIRRLASGVLAASMCYPALPAIETVEIPADTRVYLQTDELVSGRRRTGVQEGDVVRCHVWRDVVIDGRTVIEAGTEAMARVDEVKHARIAGVKGKLVIGAVETRTVDGQPVELDGGYNKAGKNRIGLSVALGALVALPLIFITGKPAELPAGTVFDSYTMIPKTIRVESDAAAPAIPKISLSDLRGAFSAAVDLQRLQEEKKPKHFYISVSEVPKDVESLVIDRVNEAEVEPLQLEIVTRESGEDTDEVLARIRIKSLVEQFTKGINRFEVAGISEGERIASEVVLDIQF